MAQLNLDKTDSFQVPFSGAKGYGFDMNGNPVMVNEDGSTAILGIQTSVIKNIVANLGVGALSGLPTTFTTGDVYVTWDTKKVYTAIDTVLWNIQDLQDNQFVTDTLSTNIHTLLYQYKGSFLHTIGLTFGSQVIAGIKTFTSFPKTPESAPVDDYDVANKRFVLDTAGGLWDDRGNYDASVNTFPASGGSGTAGAIKKADIWLISVGGTLEGVTVVEGQTVRALVDDPGQTAGNWAISAGTLVNDINAIHTDVAAEINGLTEKTVLEDDDVLVGETSTGGVWSKIKIALSSIRAYIGLLFSTDVTELRSNGTASLGLINKLPKIDHVHPLSNRIIYGGQTVEIPGSVNIITTASAGGAGSSMDIPLGQSLLQTFRNEIVGSEYLPAFNIVSIWMWGSSIVQMDLFRGGVDGVLLETKTVTLVGNGAFYSFNSQAVPASPLEIFTIRITRTGISSFVGVIKADPPYPYANAVLNGVIQSSSAYFLVQASSISYTTPVHTVEVDANGILFKINGVDAFRIDEYGLLKSLTTDYEDSVLNDNDIPNRKWVLNNGTQEIFNSYIVGATPLASDWLGLTVSGAALTPVTGKIYIILTAGDYANFQYRWTGSAYVSIGVKTGSETDPIFTQWLGETPPAYPEDIPSIEGLAPSIWPLETWYYFSSTAGDAVGDTRTGNFSGWQIWSVCTVANATRGAGTWVYVECKYSKNLAQNAYIEVPDSFGTSYNIKVDHNRGTFYGKVSGSTITTHFTETDFIGLTIAYTSSKVRITNLWATGQPVITINPTNHTEGGA